MTRNRVSKGRLRPPPFAPQLSSVIPERREERIPVSLEGWVELESERHPVEFLDLSTSGFRAKSPVPVPIGSAVAVWLPAYGELRVQIRWALCGCFGGLFLDRRVEVGEGGG
jgi:hypothetical protein